MWTVDHHGESAAQPATVFALLADAARWPEWNEGVHRIDLDGPFAAGTAATMVLPDGTSLPFRLAWVDPARGFEDVTEVPDAGVVVRVAHLLEHRRGPGRGGRRGRAGRQRRLPGRDRRPMRPRRANRARRMSASQRLCNSGRPYDAESCTIEEQP